MAEETSSTKLFTLAEVEKHNTNRSTWLCIHNSVYDVTEFLNEVRFILYFICTNQSEFKVQLRNSFIWSDMST